MITTQQALNAMINQDTLYYIGKDGQIYDMIPGVIGRYLAYLQWQNHLTDYKKHIINEADERYVVMSLDSRNWKCTDELYLNKDEVIQIVIARKQSEIETLCQSFK